MTADEERQLKIDILIRLNGLTIPAYTLEDLAQRQRARDTVDAAMVILETHGLTAARMEGDDEGGFFLAVSGPDEDDDFDFRAAHDLDEGTLKNDLDQWDGDYGRAAKDLDMDCCRRMREQDMPLSDKEAWLAIAYGEDLLAPAEALKRAARAPVGPEAQTPSRHRRRP